MDIRNRELWGSAKPKPSNSKSPARSWMLPSTFPSTPSLRDLNIQFVNDLIPPVLYYVMTNSTAILIPLVYSPSAPPHPNYPPRDSDETKR